MLEEKEIKFSKKGQLLPHKAKLRRRTEAGKRHTSSLPEIQLLFWSCICDFGDTEIRLESPCNRPIETVNILGA